MSAHRLMSGTQTNTTITGSSNYLISNFTLCDDMLGQLRFWKAAQAELEPIARGLSRAFTGGQYVTGYAGGLLFSHLTPKMVDHLYTNIFSSAPIAAVTAYVHVGGQEGVSSDGWITVNCEAEWFLTRGSTLYQHQPRRGYYVGVTIPLSLGVVNAS